MVRAFRKEDGTPPPQLLTVSQQVQRVSHQGTLRQASPRFQLGRGPDSVHHFGAAERSCICFGGASLTSRMSDHGDDQCRSIAHRVANLTEGCVSAGFQPFDCKMSGMCANFVPNPWQWARSPIIRFRNPSPESEPPTHTAAPATEGLPVHLSTPSWPPPIADWQARCSALSTSEFAHP